MSMAEAEVAETQVWLEFAVECGYCTKEPARELYQNYASIIATLVGMINHSESWTLDMKKSLKEGAAVYEVSTTPFDDEESDKMTR